MSFTWTSVSSGTISLASHLNEAKTNTDTLADNLGISHYSWSEMPVSQDEKITQAQIQEMQDAVDYIDTNNVCSTENTTYRATVDSTDNSSIFGTHYSTVDNNQHATYDNDQHATYNTSKKLTVHSSN